MKRIILLSSLMFLFIVSCATQNSVKQTYKSVKGNWIIDSVTYDGTGTFESTLLQDVKANCFEGSTWVFVANNNRGTYHINNKSCSTGERKFIWTVPGNKEMIEGELLLKKTDDNFKSETNAGYKLEISKLTESTMTWTIPASVNGKTVYVNMNFVKQITK